MTTLPRWNLDDLYCAPTAPELGRDLDSARALGEKFAQAYKGELAGMTGAALGQAIAEFETLSELLYKAMSYGQLLFAADTENAGTGRFLQTLREKITDISTTTLFFQLELNRLDRTVLDQQMADPAAAHYGPWVRDVRMFKEHELSDDLEKLLLEKSLSGRNSWVRLFDETQAALRFPFDGEDLTMSDILNLMSDTDGAVRKKAAKSLGGVLNDNIRLFTLITTTLAKDKATEDAWRKYPRPISERNLGNQVEDAVVDALSQSVQAAYPKLSHRYYRLKARWFGVDALDYWDRNAPLPEDTDRTYSWHDARQTVLAAYGKFDPLLADIATEFFDKRWIDAELRPGKDSGAFSHSTVPSAHPYILMNFHGKARDVMTLAHELGHGVHQVLSGPQGTLMADTPLTTAETASVFGEMLTFRSLLEGETDPKRRRILLAGKVEDMLNTVVRQIAFHQFETRVHDERAAGELSAERLGDIWMAVQRDSLGDGIRLDDDYRSFWAYIPHFIHSPFYVYAYAFGDCLVNSLYDLFAGGHLDFQAKYLQVLKAGGTRRHRELLAPFGLDATDPDFWNRGLNMISGFIDELEQGE
ncbi:MAG TPA: M3 family oligoendopeptidase [Rhodospirillales bacterium]|nr:M3 family oligoendopeptidase [Rhodospirillales bacterium]